MLVRKPLGAVSNNFPYKKITGDVVLTGTVAVTVQDRSRVVCGAACTVTPGCKAFSYVFEDPKYSCSIFTDVTTVDYNTGPSNQAYAMESFLGTLYNSLLETTSYALNNNNNLLVKCNANYALGAIINGRKIQDKTDILNAICLKFNGPEFLLSGSVVNVPTGIQSTSKMCPTNHVMISFEGKTSTGTYTWNVPETLEGMCMKLDGWMVKEDMCTNLAHTEGFWNGLNYPTDNEAHWKVFFNCPINYVIVQLTRELVNGNKLINMVRCCPVIPV
ncbi:hypothetical protein Hamer_G010151 [Homarus americanus]|uniref:Uncharacterized protein n=2 Tax=Homarus americanus TaxID=6706 RepID=A0A8J5K098_HOMAM|nr:hypothetical protein Hamer_G010151 [Homarus americanus]